MLQDDIDVRYAGFWQRVGAGLVDGVFFLPLILIVSFIEGLSRPAAFAAPLISQAASFAYVSLMTLRYGGTLGKLALGMRVRPVDGSPLMWRHVWRRSAVDIFLGIIFLISASYGLSRISFEAYSAAKWNLRSELLLAAIPWMTWLNAISMVWLASEFIVILTNRRRRALHDFIAGTVVVLVRPTATEPPRLSVEVNPV